MEDIRRAGQHHLGLLSIVQVEQGQPVGVGMRVHLPDFRHDDLVAVPANAAGLELVRLVFLISRHGQPRVLDLIHFQPRQSQLAGDFFDGQTVKVDVIF